MDNFIHKPAEPQVRSTLRMGHLGGDLICLEALAQPGLSCRVLRYNC